MKLHELGFHAKDPKATRQFYHDLLGLEIDHEQDGLVVLSGGHPAVEIGANSAAPEGQGIRYISFLVKDIDALAKQLRAKGLEFDGPTEIGLGKRGITLTDPDGLTVAIHSPTDESPPWIKGAVR